MKRKVQNSDDTPGTVSQAALSICSGVASTTYRINGGAPQSYSGAIPVSAEGTTLLACYSTDVAGNQEATQTLPVKIDKTAPTLSLDKSGTYNAPLTVTATAGDALSGVDTTQGVQMNIDGASWVKETAISVPLGSHTVNARVFDKAGNEQTASTNVTVNATVPDTTAPHTTVALGSGPAQWYPSSVTASFVATDDLTGVVTTTWWFDGRAPSVLATSTQLSVAWQPVSLLPIVGSNTLHFYSRDAGGNVEATQNVTFQVDGQAPTINGDWHPAYTNSATIHVTAIDLQSGVDTSTIETRVDGGAPQPGNVVTVSTRGAHILEARAADNVGNVSGWTAYAFTVNSSVSLAAPKVSGSAVHTRSTKFVGSVSPGRVVRVTVTIQRSVRGKYKAYRTIRVNTGPTGAWSFKYKLPKGTFRLRSTTPASTGWLAGTSGYRTVKVK